jgi:magnesium transporter
MANEMLNNTSSLYLAMISIEIAATDHKMNEAMKCFGAVATIMLPLTVMTGLWGMNVQVPGQAGIAPPGELWFMIIVLSFLVWIVVAAIVFRYKRWL